MSERFIWVYEGHSKTTKLPIWSCRREGAGFVGYGSTYEESRDAFLELEKEILPDHREREIEAAIDDHLHEQAFGDGL